MNIVVSLSDAQLEAVVRYAKEHGVSQEDAVREAVAKQIPYERKPLSAFIGILKDDDSFGDGLEYQDRMRS